MEVNRLDFLKILGCAAISTGCRLAGDEGPRLRDIAAKKNLLAGTAVSNRQLHRPTFASLLAEQASIVVPENEMKWQIIHPEPDRYDFTRADALRSFAADHNQKLRGHNLCWHNQLPAWFAEVATPANAADLLRRHNAEVAGHFAGHIHSWDVVNEAVHVEDGRPDGLRNSQWLKLLGSDYIGIAYQAAAQADPHASLTYNDYDIEQDGPKFDQKRATVLELLTSMRKQKIPVHALGLQSHLKASTKLPDWTALHDFMTAAEKLDLVIFVTELDVNDSELSGGVQERDEAVSALYRSYLTNVLQHRSAKAVLTWGLTDADSWLNSPGRPHNPEQPLRPLLFDVDLKPKAAFYAEVDAITSAPGNR